MQIDWLSGFVETPPELWPDYESGRAIKLDRFGEVIENRIIGANIKDEDPSSSRNFTVWTPTKGSLYLSGNPIKLLQDHNLWGSCDPLGCYLHAGAWVRSRVGLFPGPSTWNACEFTGPRYTRIDITRSYRFPNEDQAAAFIRYNAGTARSRHGAAKLYGSETCYFGQHSQRWSMKIYRKQKEFQRNIDKRKYITQPAVTRKLIEWSEGVVRFELVLRGREIRDKYALVDLNEQQTLLNIWNEKYSSIEFNENANMQNNRDIFESELTTNQLGILSMWRQGYDLRSIYSKPTFYRRRKQLMELVGVDISQAPVKTDDNLTTPTNLDPSGWDPEPLHGGLVEPDDQLKLSYPARD